MSTCRTRKTRADSAGPPAPSHRGPVAKRRELSICLLIIAPLISCAIVAELARSEAASSTIKANLPAESSAQAASNKAAPTSEISVRDAEESPANEIGPEKVQAPAADKRTGKAGAPNAGAGNKKCDYHKGEWQSCESDGSQQKVMRLKTGDRNVCKPSKTIRRDCKIGGIGCKYARGDWSSSCQAGQRIRIDTLVGLVDADGNEREAPPEAGPTNGGQAQQCKPQRRVTKDCGRTCHYVKSAWSECSPDGFRTRVLTLEASAPEGAGQKETKGLRTFPAAGSGELPAAWNATTRTAPRPSPPATTPTSGKQRPSRAGDNQICARQKLIRRECRANSKLASGQPQERQQQQQQQQLQPRQSANAQTGSSSNMKQIQRRRLKQIQSKQTTTTTQTSAPGNSQAELAKTATTTAPKTTTSSSSAKTSVVVDAATSRPAKGKQAK